jgi:hypothetical protein
VDHLGTWPQHTGSVVGNLPETHLIYGQPPTGLIIIIAVHGRQAIHSSLPIVLFSCYKIPSTLSHQEVRGIALDWMTWLP